MEYPEDFPKEQGMNWQSNEVEKEWSFSFHRMIGYQ